MKKLWKLFRDWLIRKLGGFTQQEVAKTIEEWIDKKNAYEDHIARLELERNVAQKKNVELTRENGILKMELDRIQPARKMLKEETCEPRIIRAEEVIHRYPEDAVDIVGITKDRLARQILDAAQQAISYHFQNDFAGNSRVIATLWVLVRSEVL